LICGRPQWGGKLTSDARSGRLQFRFRQERSRVLSQMTSDIGTAHKNRNRLKLVRITAKIVWRLGNPFVFHRAIMLKGRSIRIPQ